MANSIEHIEEWLVDYLTAKGFSVSALPIPTDLENNLPFVVLQRTGGMMKNIAIAINNITFYVYAKNEDEANSYASQVTTELVKLEGELLGGVQVYSVDADGFPSYVDDYDQPTLSRCSFNVNIYIRNTFQ